MNFKAPIQPSLTTPHGCCCLIVALLVTLIHGCTNTRIPAPRLADRLPAKTVNLPVESNIPHNTIGEDELFVQHQLAYIEALLQAQQIQLAQERLQQLQAAEAHTSTRSTYFLLQAKVASLQHRSQRALRWLDRIEDPSTLTSVTLQTYHLLYALAYQKTNQPLESVQHRVALAPMLRDQEAAWQNQQEIWYQLLKLSPTYLSRLTLAPAPDPLSGWLELSYLAKIQQDDQSMSRSIQQWQKRYPTHPANTLLPNRGLSASIAPANQVALLLPLSGTHQQTAEAIRDGFAAAYFASDASDKISFTVYDTHDDTRVIEQARTALLEGADLIIGPLTKEGIRSLAQTDLGGTPILALNYLDDETPLHANIWEFGLSPIDEAQQISRHAASHGQRQAFLLTPESEWGDRVADAFERTWQEMGRNVIGRQHYQDKQPLQRLLKQILGIEDSERRAHQLRRSMQLKFDFQPRSRQDIELFFVAGTSHFLRQLKPLLNYHDAGHIKIYTLPLGFDGAAQARESDLEGIQFCDMPWLLEPDTFLEMRDSALLRQASRADERLFALGLDAFLLSQQLGRLSHYPELGLHASTGILSAQGRRVQRHLTCVEVRDGQAVLLSHV